MVWTEIFPEPLAPFSFRYPQCYKEKSGSVGNFLKAEQRYTVRKWKKINGYSTGMKFRNQKKVVAYTGSFRALGGYPYPILHPELSRLQFCFLAARFKCWTALRNKYVVKASSFTIFETSIRTNKSHSNTT
jgi:hypothetical protein